MTVRPATVASSILALVLAACAGSSPAPASPPAPSPALPAPAAAPPAATSATAAPPEAAPMPDGSGADAKAYEAATAFTAAEVKKVVRQHFDRVGACYEKGLQRDPDLKGTVDVRLTISQEGRVVGAVAKKDPPGPRPTGQGGALTDREVVTCIEQVFESLKFAPTGQGMVNLVYPVELRTE